ncbi:MAG: hypothetical protein MUC48_20010 [Leptolyngbya sp. Prado105]|jgi:hypothetical protein|nr:hypothetical protein [Leptolyngbya sp. Prado105]
MPRQAKRTLSPLEKAKERLIAIKNINPNLDMGRGLSVQAYTAAIEKSNRYQEIYNSTLATLNADRIAKEEADKELKEITEKMLLGVAIEFGKDSPEYEIAGGTRKSKRKRSTRKKSQPDSTEAAPLATL